ncbi:hypothetical protein ACHHYP_07524 [Achlya hypogyna]|uniref:BED-type domain-containing protein n=1 Tax=Achlya hypogyna TaxID=1202772 RepID=A0A1V9YQV5_ACHHY|nr:hypothetical protein ACHHYP_07524 [Achlya hypogyna]
MGRHRDPLWKWFDETPVTRPGKVTACVTCKFCRNYVCAVTTSLKRHLEICRKRDPALLPDASLPPVDLHHKRRAPTPDEEAFLAQGHSAKRTRDDVKVDARLPKQDDLDKLLARAVFQSGTPVSTLHHESFQAFFKAAAPAYIFPTATDLYGRLLDAEYAAEIDGVRAQLASSGAAMLALHPTDPLLTLFTPVPSAISAPPVRHDGSVGGLFDYATAARRHARGLLAPTPETAADPWNVSVLPFLAFCGDTTPAMQAVRDLLEKEEAPDAFDFTYGDVASALDGVCRDICALPGPKQLLKKALVLLFAIGDDSSLSTLFEETALDVLQAPMSVPGVFSPAQFGSVVAMFAALDGVRGVVTALPAALANNDAATTTMPPALTAIIYDAAFWKAVKALVHVLSPVADAIAYLQSPDATFSAVYAAYLHLKMHFLDTPSRVFEATGLLPSAHHEYPRGLVDILGHHVAAVYTPVHALAFRCDPFYDGLRTAVVDKYGAATLDLTGELLSECRRGLAHLCRKVRGLETKVLSQFCLYCTRTSAAQDVFAMTKTMLPNCIWGQATSQFPDLAALLVHIFACPATARRERGPTPPREATAEQRQKLALLVWNDAHRMQKQHSLYRDCAYAKTLARLDGDVKAEASVPEPTPLEVDSNLRILLASLPALESAHVPDAWLFGAHANGAMQQLSETAYGAAI